MVNHRVSRLNEQFRRELTDIIRNSLRDPRIGVLTITDVRVTSDLDQARVFVSLSGEPEERQQTMEGLKAAAPFIRGEIGRRLKIRHTPELRFDVDETLEHARRIEALLATVRPPAEPPVVSEEDPGDETDADDEQKAGDERTDTD